MGTPGGRAVIQQLQAIEQALLATRENAARLFNEMGLAWAEEARAACPVAPTQVIDGIEYVGGAGRDSIRWVLDGPTKGHLEANEYLLYVDEGTAPHRIAARNGGVLRFGVGGTTLFRPWVEHPGTRAHPFIRNAFDSPRVQALVAALTEGTTAFGDAVVWRGW